MSNMSHSPGPWSVWRGKRACEVRDARGIVIAELADETGDARLIAAAPRLLKLVRSVVDGDRVAVVAVERLLAEFDDAK